MFRFTLIKKGGRKKRELFIEIEERGGGGEGKEEERCWNGGGIDLVRERTGEIMKISRKEKASEERWRS